MKKSLLNLLTSTSKGLVYEIDLSNNNIIWHTNINKELNYSEDKKLDSINKLLDLINTDDHKTYKNKLLSNEDGKIVFKIKNQYGYEQTFEDTYIYFKDDKEELILGVCKNITKKDLKLSNILDSSDDLIFYKDLNFTYTGCNDAFCNFLNLPKSKIIGKNDYELFDVNFANLFRTMDEKILEKKKSHTNKEWVKFPNNEDVLLLTQKSPLFDNQGEIYGLLGIARDITKELEVSKKEADDNKKSYKQLFEANKIPVLIICPDTGKILNANKASLNFYGYSLKEIRSLHIYDINILSDDEINEEMSLAKKEQRDCFNFKHKLKDGEVIDVEVYSGPMKYNNKTILYSIIFNITKRRNIEAKLKQAHTIYQNTKEGIFITDLNGYVLSVNKAFEDITGYKEEEVIDHKINLLKSNLHNKNFYRDLWDGLIQKGIWEGEIINRNKSGLIFPQWLTINTVYDENHKPLNYIAVFSDFTKLKEQEKLLREKDQIMFQQSKMAAMGEMLRNIAHQWRQPLSVISSSATGLKLKKEFGILEDNDFEEFAEGILKSSKYLSETIEDFSNYFKNDKNKEHFLISNVIKRTIQLSEASLKNHNISLEITNIKDYKIYGIKNELIQVLLNIINNSKDAFKNLHTDNPLLEISTKRVDGDIVIYIKDNAGGIDENIIEKIFEPYFTTKHQSQGTGIGLYMSQQIVSEHLKGSISARNLKNKQNKKIGVEFKIIIPLPKDLY